MDRTDRAVYHAPRIVAYTHLLRPSSKVCVFDPLAATQIATDSSRPVCKWRSIAGGTRGPSCIAADDGVVEVASMMAYQDTWCMAGRVLYRASVFSESCPSSRVRFCKRPQPDTPERTPRFGGTKQAGGDVQRQWPVWERVQGCIMILQIYALDSFSVNSGTFSNRSPTRPTSATWKMGASASLLMAAITLLSFMPARCWMAPEMPQAM